MMKKKFYFLVILLFVISTNNAQQAPHYTQYMYNMQTINPAYVGVRSDLSLALLSRSQWVGVKGAPKTQSLAFQSRAFDGVGIGISAVHDEIGLLKETVLNLDLSYTLMLSQYNRLALGLKGAVSFFKNDLASGITPDNDVYASVTGNYPNVGFGAFYYNEQFYIGFSMPSLLKTPKFKANPTFSNAGVTIARNYFFTTGYVLNINDHFKLKPSTLVKYVNNLPLSIDVNANMLYNNKFELGVSYRYNDAVSAMAAFHVNTNFRIGYAYDYTISNFSGYNAGSHEVFLLYDVFLKKRGRWLESDKCFF